MQVNGILRVVQDIDQPPQLQRRGKAQRREAHVLLRYASLLYRPGFPVVPAHRQSTAAQVDDRLDAVVLGQLRHETGGWLGATIDPARQHRVEVMPDEPPARFATDQNDKTQGQQSPRNAPAPTWPAPPAPGWSGRRRRGD